MIKLSPKHGSPVPLVGDNGCFAETPPLFKDKHQMHIWIEDNRYEDLINPFAYIQLEWVDEAPIPRSSLNPSLFSSGDLEGSYEWSTPDALFQEYHSKNWYEVDLAASSINTKLPTFLGPTDAVLPEYIHLCAMAKHEDKAVRTEYKGKAQELLTRTNCNGLEVDWHKHWKKGWLNPPYGREVYYWVEKAYNEIKLGMHLVTMLLPARTDTEWFHKFIHKAYKNQGGGVRGAIIFLRGRVSFEIDGRKLAGAPFPSIIVHLSRWRSPYTEGGE